MIDLTTHRREVRASICSTPSSATKMTPRQTKAAVLVTLLGDSADAEILFAERRSGLRRHAVRSRSREAVVTARGRPARHRGRESEMRGPRARRDGAARRARRRIGAFVTADKVTPVRRLVAANEPIEPNPARECASVLAVERIRAWRRSRRDAQLADAGSDRSDATFEVGDRLIGAPPPHPGASCSRRLAGSPGARASLETPRRPSRSGRRRGCPIRSRSRRSCGRRRSPSSSCSTNQVCAERSPIRQ